LQSPAQPLVDAVKTPVGVFSRLDIRISKFEPEENEALPVGFEELNKKTLILKGLFSYKDIPNRNITIPLEFDDELRFENVSGLEIIPDTTLKWVAIFNSLGWLSESNITQCLDSGQLTLEGDGSLIIDQNSLCDQVASQIVENFKESTSLAEFEHDDDDK